MGQEFEPYVIALGKFALAWNDLQYNLCGLFSIVTLEEPPRAGDAINFVPAYIWHAIKSDRSQLDMLRAAITTSKLSKGNDLIECGTWLCARVTSLEDRRNDIMHSALMLANFGTDTVQVVPNTFLKHPRAKKLEDAVDLLDEFRSARHTAILLSDYAEELTRVAMNPHLPWPSKPSLQGRQQKGTSANPTPPKKK